VTPGNGGRGAAREVCELIMDAQGTLRSSLQHYLD
jgi:3-deoxy-D-manno-octulosonate 8-phosphate phosphatase (KDO 8-P phosphatase)